MHKRSAWLLMGLAVILGASTALADARVVSGRSRPVDEVQARRGPSRVRLLLGGGMSAAGDLFSYESSVSRDVQAPVGGTFKARRFTATLDEDVLLDGGILYQLRPTVAVRLSARWSEMGLTALANDTQIVTPAPWDQVTLTQISLLVEKGLAVGEWVPYVTAGASLLKVDAIADSLDQDGVVPIFGAGLRFRPSERFGLWAEILDSIRQIDSENLFGDVLRDDGEFTESGPQHFVGMVVGLELGF